MDETDPDIEAAREALRNIAAPRKATKTAHTVIKALLPEIEERLKTHSVDDVLPAIELALGKKIARPTFMSTLCRVRKEAAEANPTGDFAAKVRRRVKAAINGK